MSGSDTIGGKSPSFQRSQYEVLHFSDIAKSYHKEANNPLASEKVNPKMFTFFIFFINILIYLSLLRLRLTKILAFILQYLNN